MVASILHNRYLIIKSIQREVYGRYRGSFLGILWSFFTPLLMLAVYTFVFSVVFKARWGGGSGSKTEFALLLFAGLIVYNLFAECINRAPSLIMSNNHYVTRVVYPIEIFPVINLGSAIFHMAISLVVWLLAYTVLFGMPHATTLYLPVILFPLGFFILGLCWLLSSLGVYLRDVNQIISIITTALLFLSPIFYSADRLPPQFQIIMHINPLSGVIEQTRNALFWGIGPSPSLLALQYVGAALVCCLGFAWFQKTRKGFADVI